AFMWAVTPGCSAGACTRGADKSRLIHREIEYAVDHDGCGLTPGLRVGHQTVGLPDPRDAQVFNIVAIDLIEGRVVSTPVLAAVSPPFTVFCALLRNDRMDPQQRGDEQPQRHETKQSWHRVVLP